MPRWMRLVVSVALLTALGVVAGLYIKLKLQESQRPALPPGFEAKLAGATKVTDGLLKLGELRAMLKDAPEEAVRRLRAFIEGSPGSAEASEARLILAEALAGRGDAAGAIAQLEAVVADPRAGARACRARLERARILAATDPAAARRDLEAVIRDDDHPPLQHKATLELGLLELKAGDFSRAIATLTPLTLRNYPEKPAALDGIRQAIAGQAREVAAGSDPKALLAWGDAMIEKFPELTAMHDDIRFQQAGALRQLGRFAEARVALERLRGQAEGAADRESACLAELERVTQAEDAAGVLRSRQAFLDAKAAGTETRASFEGDLDADATWAKANSPLVLTGKAAVKPGAALTIEPGCVVQLLPGARLVVQGALIARGTADEPVRFTSAVPKAPTFFDGEGIFFADSSADDRCRLEHCVVEYQRVGVACAAASPALRSCTLARNGRAALLLTDGAEPRIEGQCRIERNDGTGLQAEGSTVALRQCLVLGNGGDGIRLADKCKGAVEACRIRANAGSGIAADNFSSPAIRGNEIAENGGDGVRCNRFSQPAIHGNVIRGNRGTGIRATLDSAAEITGNLIEGNGDHPLVLERSDGTLKANTIVRNRPYGVHCARSASPLIEGNWIEGNGGCGIICGEASSPVITGNAILGQTKAITNTGTLTVRATENWFGAVDDARMRGLLFGKADQASLGDILWQPRLTAPPARPPTPQLDLPPLTPAGEGH